MERGMAAAQCWRRCSLGQHVHIIAAKQLSASLSASLPVSLSVCPSVCDLSALCQRLCQYLCLFRVPVGNLRLSSDCAHCAVAVQSSMPCSLDLNDTEIDFI